jgi:aspartate ammonia-lyase
MRFTARSLEGTSEAIHGVQTARPRKLSISDARAPAIRTATILVKKAAAEANAAPTAPRDMHAKILAASDEILGGELRDQL